MRQFFGGVLAEFGNFFPAFLQKQLNPNHDEKTNSNACNYIAAVIPIRGPECPVHQKHYLCGTDSIREKYDGQYREGSFGGIASGVPH